MLKFRNPTLTVAARRGVGVDRCGVPYVNVAGLRATDDVLAVRAEACRYLQCLIPQALELANLRESFHLIEPEPAVISTHLG